MHKELDDNISRKHWKIIPSKSPPKWVIPIFMVWSMKIKRNTVGERKKQKARICDGGHISIEGIDYWNTYSMSLSWRTVWLMTFMALLIDWHMQSIDFVIAFPQSPIKEDI